MTIDAPVFFVPHATVEEQESVYRSFAELCGGAVPPPGERIYSIHFRHNGEDWTATVGEKLRGARLDRVRRRGRQDIERRQTLSDPATVLAIFAGSPYMVVTNHRIAKGAPNVGSRWENPFLVGDPVSVTHFATSKPV